MKVWISKYALTQGIFEMDAKILENMAISTVRDFPTCYHGEGKEWHRTKGEAIKRAEEHRLNKITSLKKQLSKMESLKFD